MTNLSESELIGMRKRQRAALSKEDQMNLLDQFAERIDREEHEKFKRETLEYARKKREAKEQSGVPVGSPR
jgi:hypothetical protein